MAARAQDTQTLAKNAALVCNLRESAGTDDDIKGLIYQPVALRRLCRPVDQGRFEIDTNDLGAMYPSPQISSSIVIILS